MRYFTVTFTISFIPQLQDQNIYKNWSLYYTELKCGGENRVGSNELFRSCVLGSIFGFRTCELYTRFN